MQYGNNTFTLSVCLLVSSDKRHQQYAFVFRTAYITPSRIIISFPFLFEDFYTKPHMWCGARAMLPYVISKHQMSVNSTQTNAYLNIVEKVLVLLME